MEWSTVLPHVGWGSGWAVTLLFVVAILRGDLVPRRTHDDALHDRNEWRGESRIKDQQIHVKDEQLRHLAEVGRTVESIMSALRSGPPTPPPPSQPPSGGA